MGSGPSASLERRKPGSSDRSWTSLGRAAGLSSAEPVSPSLPRRQPALSFRRQKQNISADRFFFFFKEVTGGVTATDALGNRGWLLPLLSTSCVTRRVKLMRGEGSGVIPKPDPRSFPRERWRVLSARSGDWFISIFWSVSQQRESFTAEMFKWLFGIQRWL